MSRPCGACSLPPALQHHVVEERRRLVPLRMIADQLREAGHPLSKDALLRHFETCVPASLLDEPADTADRPDLAVARAAADCLARWSSIARSLSDRLHRDGYHEAAEIVASVLPELMRPGHPLCLPEYQAQANSRQCERNVT
jgi:hypothetical protein